MNTRVGIGRGFIALLLLFGMMVMADPANAALPGKSSQELPMIDFDVSEHLARHTVINFENIKPDDLAACSASRAISAGVIITAIEHDALLDGAVDAHGNVVTVDHVRRVAKAIQIQAKLFALAFMAHPDSPGNGMTYSAILEVFILPKSEEFGKTYELQRPNETFSTWLNNQYGQFCDQLMLLI